MHDDLGARFASYATKAAGDDAPTHRLLAGAVAGDDELLAVVAAAPPDRRHPNNLFAAVRFLLLGGLDHRLGGLYAEDEAGRASTARAAIADATTTTGRLVDAFADLVVSHRDDVLAAMAARPVQTNEPARCAHVAAGLALVQHRHGRVGLVDVGTSAGLNLMVDRCRIDYGAVVAGPVDAPLQLRCELLGAAPPVPTDGLAIGWRRGLDREPLDLADEPSRRWLQACVWIDQPDRSERLAAAIAAAWHDPPAIVTGDAVDDLPGLLAAVPPDLHAVVMTTWVTYYLSDGVRRDLAAVMADARRPVSWLSLEAPGVVEGVARPDDTPSPDIVPSVLALVTWPGDGSVTREFLGWAHHHGTWLDWRGPHT